MRNSLSVKQLGNYIKNVFEDELVLQNICVTGEVFEASLSKYTFITLKEDEVTMNCVCFKKIILPKIGEKVILTGSVNYNSKSSRISFIFNSLQVIGEGLCQAEYLKLKEKLKNQGFFDRKLPLPSFITDVCIITSSSGSVVHDFLSGIEDGHSYINVSVYASSVQGNDAETELVSQLRKADERDFDVIVLARGGGSASDLECFNGEKLATAVANAQKPIISAIGHETDYSLCDLCASHRAGTPSFAAKLITENNMLLINKFMSQTTGLTNAIDNKFRDFSTNLSDKAAKVAYEASQIIGENYNYLRAESDYLYAILKDKIKSQTYFVENCATKINNSVNMALTKKENAFSECCVKMEYSSPLKILSKGYALVYNKDQKQILSVKDAKKNNRLKIVISDGAIVTDVVSTEEFI